MFANFKEYHGNHKNFKSLCGFGGCRLKIRDVCMDFELYFKVHNLVSVHPKSIILGQMTNLNTIFYVVCQFIDWLKFGICPSSLLNFGSAYIANQLYQRYSNVKIKHNGSWTKCQQ